MMTFKQYIENLWGEIPWPYRKPSDGQGGQAANPSKTDTPSGGGGTPMGMPPGGSTPMMMKKKMGKKMKKV